MKTKNSRNFNQYRLISLKAVSKLRRLFNFFLNGLLSVKNLIDTFKVFSLFSELKANFSKCEIAGLGSLKVVLEAVCGLKSINLATGAIKILGVHISYNGTLSKCFVFGTVEFCR